MSKVKSPVQAGEIGDEEFLENYLGFAVTHRWTIAKECFERFLLSDENSRERPALSLEIFFCYCLIIEDILMWYYALEKWSGQKDCSLMNILNGVNLTPQMREDAVNQLRSMSVGNFCSLYCVPPESQCRHHGMSNQSWKKLVRELTQLQSNLKAVLEAVIEGRDDRWPAHWLIRSLNKVRHGLLVMMMHEKPFKLPLVGILIKGNKLWMPDGKPARISCTIDEGSVRIMLEQTKSVSLILASMVKVVFEMTYKRYPRVTWPKEWVSSEENK